MLKYKYTITEMQKYKHSWSCPMSRLPYAALVNMSCLIGSHLERLMALANLVTTVYQQEASGAV